MKTIPYNTPLPAGTIEAFNRPEGVLCIMSLDDYAQAPAEVQSIVARRADSDAAAAAEVETVAAFEAEQQAARQAEYEAFKLRGGQPVYKAHAVKVAAEKLGITALIESAIAALVAQAGDKSLAVWWTETDQLSRGYAQWQQIEAALQWPKGMTADQLFELAAQIAAG